MLMAMRRADMIESEKFRDGMDALRERYPFMDVVILSRYAGMDRDRSYAYNVLGRIPPGQKDDIAEMVGITGDMIQKFWDGKGDLENWAETDRDRFMAGIIDIGAMLSIPEDALKNEWEAASDVYSDVIDQMVERFGADIQQEQDYYFMLRREDANAANEYLKANPQVEASLTFKDRMILESDAAKYYASLSTYERYYKGMLYDMLDAQFGDMSDVWDELDDAKLQGSKAEKAFRKAHPEIDEYYDMRASWEKIFNEALVRATKYMQEPEFPELRGAPESMGQTDIYAGVTGGEEENVYDITWEQASQEMSPYLQRLVLDAITGGKPLSYAARNQLEYISERLGVDDVDMLLEILEQNIE